MKALFWQYTLITTLCLAAQCIAAPFDNSRYLQVSNAMQIRLTRMKKASEKISGTRTLELFVLIRLVTENNSYRVFYN